MYRQLQAKPSSSSSSSYPVSASRADKERWKQIQFSLKRKLIEEDDFGWKVPSPTTTTCRGEEKEETLKYVGGVDISYSKENPSLAYGMLVVLDFHTLDVVYEDFSLASPHVPYVAGFLAFREVPILQDLLEKMKQNKSPYFPQIVMVDGNGLLHPRGFGSACQLGVLANIPTIGIGKNLHFVDGLTDDGVHRLLEAKENISKDFIFLKGRSGLIWGAAMRPTRRTQKPIFISVGHRVSLQTAIKIVKRMCVYRVPEPIRQADLISREYIRKHDRGTVVQQNGSNLDRIVDGMRKMEIHNKEHQDFGEFSRGSSHHQTSGKTYNEASYQATGACFECGEIGHWKRDCPELQRQLGSSQRSIPAASPSLGSVQKTMSLSRRFGSRR